ncbi:MAG: EamA family transporter [Clostridia bacterium]|nr:EamA family transporter [Clostridia bacterium]
MIYVLLAVLTGAGKVTQSALTKMAGEKGVQGGTFFFNAAKAGSVGVLLFLITLSSFSFHLPTFWYAVVYTVSLALSMVFGYLALLRGPMSLTSAIVAYSAVMPCAYSILVLNEPLTLWKGIGLGLLFFAVYLLRKEETGSKQKEKHWLWYLVLTFLFTGFCSVIQKQHQAVYPGEYCNEFSVLSFVFTAAIFLLLGLLRRERSPAASLVYSLPAGLFMGLASYLTLFLSSRMEGSLLFPLVTVTQTILNLLLSMLLFRERLCPRQIVGLVLGLFSILLIR